MTADLKILILEDNDDDADLLLRELKRSELIFTSRIVQSREAFKLALTEFGPDIVLSDYALPQFDAVAAFAIKESLAPHTPFIIVSGTIGEENAVGLIKNGITDYVQKDKLFTLPQKISRALKDTAERKEKKINAEKLKIQAKELYRANEELYTLNQHLEKRVFERTGELEKLNHELKDLNLSKDKFVTVISHDLRNPLAVLLLACEALSSRLNEPAFDHVQPFVKIIHRSSQNILQQLNDLVQWAKSQQEKTALNLEKLSLVTAVNDSFELLKPNTLLKGIVLENKVPPGIAINADAVMLRSILQNLVTNSIKYSSPGGLVIVTARHIDTMTEICIIDSGIGMDADTTANLFTGSNTASEAGTNNETGSGLGLILVKDFVTQQGGTISVESEIKKGTRISFTVPAYL